MSEFKRLIGLGGHLMSAAFLLFLIAATTHAYSIVMRGGKRIEIPDKFNVTAMTLTYETSPGFWVTLQMSVIDVPATERANNERPGSLLARATREKEPLQTLESKSEAQAPRASRSVTNRDLESFERVRLESERAYEQKLKELGLPPLAVLRAQAEEKAERFWQEMAQKRAEAEAAERAAQLQAQIAALNAQLNQIQATLAAGPSHFYDGFAFFGGFPFFDFGRSKVNRSLFGVPPGIPIGGAFGTFHVPFFSQRHGLRRNVFVAPGTRVHGGRGFGGRRHVGRRH